MKKKDYVVVGLLSVSLISLELIWTRLLSAEFFYTFAFLVLSMAVMGLGMGALLVRLFPLLNRGGWVGFSLLMTTISGIASPVLIFKLGLKFNQLFSDWMMLGKAVLSILLLGLPFLFGGIVLAVIFKRNHESISRLYMYDMFGAACGVFVAIYFMNKIGTPYAAFLVLIYTLIAAIIYLPKYFKAIPIAMMLSFILLIPQAMSLLEPEREERAPVIYKHWDAISKIKLYHYGDEARGINIDNVANSPVFKFDGNWDADTTESEWSINVAYLVDRFDSCTFLSLGSGGGGDVLQALDHGATEIHAVEVNPHINKMMTEGDRDGYIIEAIMKLADTLGEDSISQEKVEPASVPIPVTLVDFSGRIYHDPKVTVVSEDARTYVKRFENKFDIIYSLSSNSWAALGSGSFALAENYIFTTEAFIDYWNVLSDSGFLSMEHQVYMPRLVPAVMEALDKLGVENPQNHFAVYDLPKMRRNLLLLSKQPLDDSLRYYAYGALTDDRFEDIHLLYPPATDSLADNLINRIVLNGWEAEADSAKVDISPSRDDRPFVAQMGLWKNFSKEGLGKIHQWADFRGFPLSKMVILIVLAIVGIIFVPLTFVPYLRGGLTLKFSAWLYFFFIGVGFMIIEIILIQKYALFIGASIYSIATVLLTLLLSSAIGSRYSEKFADWLPFAGIVVWIGLDILLLGQLTSTMTSLPIYFRALVTGLLVAPVGFFMGMPFPKAARAVGSLIDWGFAVNGVASVLGATFAIMLAMEYGLATTLVSAAAFYLVAMILLSRKQSWG